MWVILGLIAFSILLEPKSEVRIANVLIEAISFVSIFVPVLCLRYLSGYGSMSEMVFTHQLFLIPVLGALLVVAIDFCISWITIMDQLLAKILSKKKSAANLAEKGKLKTKK